MDNSTLIQTFVKGLVQGQFVMLSNADLKTEVTFNSMQLLARVEGLISAAKLNDTPLSAFVLHDSSYWEMLHQAMIAQKFFPLLQLTFEKYYTYQHQNIPEGYTVHCTTALELWRRFLQRGRDYRYSIPLDLLVLTQGVKDEKTWSPLRSIDSENGALEIKLLGRRIRVGGTDLVVWLEQVQESGSKALAYRRRRLFTLLGSSVFDKKL